MSTKAERREKKRAARERRFERRWMRRQLPKIERGMKRFFDNAVAKDCLPKDDDFWKLFNLHPVKERSGTITYEDVDDIKVTIQIEK